jgi:hypothetical protein
MTVTQHPAPVAGARYTRRAWWSLLGFVPSLVLAFVIGEGLISLLGYPCGGEEQPPWRAVLVAVTPALVVFVLPAVAAVHFGRRAVRLGDAGGRRPMVVALVVAAGFVLLNGISALTILFGG